MRRRSTISARRLTVALVLFVVLSGTAAAVASVTTTPPPSQQGVAAAPAADPSEPARSPSAYEPAATRAPDETGDAGTEATEPARRGRRMTDAQLVEARQVAADFAGAYASYSYRESPEAAAARVAPYVTAELAAQLARNAGGAVGREILTEREQEAVASVETVSTQRVAPDGVDLLVVVAQEITSRDGAETRWPSYRLRVARDGTGWRVSALQP